MSTETTFVELFQQDSEQAIHTIEIPLIQRDYAQGRRDESATKIREAFVQVLHDALTGPSPEGLDFVYGDVEDGCFQPLDGQQRLSTLFLLHWYLACKAEVDLSTQAWRRFSYATRTSARRFCERLARHALPSDEERAVSDWIVDQPWFMALWKHDPTIDSMLVMLDTIEQQFQSRTDFPELWRRLVEERTITFHRLAIDDMGQPDRLYVKMNSRGKPLTPFENLKARLERALRGSPRARELAQSIDGPWANILLPYRGDDDLIDDECLRYLHFVTEVCEWRRDREPQGGVEERVIATFAGGTQEAEQDLDFLFEAFNTWVGEKIAQYFAARFVASGAATACDDQVVLFGSTNPNLFEECLRQYGDYAGKRRLFDFGQTLLLYAVLLHRIHETEDFTRRARIIRNLVEASTNEIRLDNMPKLVADVAAIVQTSDVATALANSSFAKHQRDNEVAKLSALEADKDLLPTLHRLEDHQILRGSLNAFDLDEHLPHRADTFVRLMSEPAHWKLLTAALLAVGDYSRQTWHSTFQFGSPSHPSWWREVLTGQSFDDLAGTRSVLQQLLDQIPPDAEDIASVLAAIKGNWLEETDVFDWRYYLVKYDAMREGTSGIYVNQSSGMSYDMVMLDKRQLNSRYRDPFLYAILRDNPAATGIQDASEGPRFTGYVKEPRWLVFRKSGLRLRFVPEGLELVRPDESFASHFEGLQKMFSIDPLGLIHVEQVDHDDRLVDIQDRISLGRQVVQTAVDCGF